MACAVERVRHELCDLLDTSTESWTPQFEERITAIFNDEIVGNMFRCSCLQPPDGQARGLQLSLASIQRSRRLFATCIIAGKSRLVISFLRSRFDDSGFEASNSEGLLVRSTGIDRVDAKILLGMKHLFFGINLAMYLRSTREKDRPNLEERNWLLDEVLEAVRKIAFASPTDPRTLRYPATSRIGDLIIRKDGARATDRRDTSPSKIRRDQITTQSLGYLVLDLIWFILGGGQYVIWLDNYRSEGVNWVKQLSTAALERKPDLLMAFEMVWILIQPPQKSFTLIGEDEFQYVHTQFHRIWPSTTVGIILTRDSNQSGDSSISTVGVSAVRRQDFKELRGARDFRWIILQFCEGEHVTGCRMRIFKSTDKMQSELRFDIYSVRHHPVKPKHHYVEILKARFVPLYAYDTGSSGYEMMIQPITGSARHTTMPFIFRFRTLEDVQKFQTVLTGRQIVKDVALGGFYLDVRKPTFRILHAKEEGLSWVSRQRQGSNPSFGRIQVWEVMDTSELDKANEYERNGTRAPRNYSLRFQLAIFSDSMLIILGVKSLLNLCDLDESGLLLESKEGTKNTCLEGRSFRTRCANDETLYPGLPLFQAYPFEPSPEGENVTLKSLSCYFVNGDARDDMRDLIADTQRPPKDSYN